MKKMKSLLKLSGSINELNKKQKIAIGHVIESFNGEIQFKQGGLIRK